MGKKIERGDKMSKKTIILIQVLFCVFSLPAQKSKDVVLKLNLKMKTFTRYYMDSKGETIEETTKKSNWDNYHAYNGRSLTFEVTEANPFIYTVVINGRAYEYFHDQKDFVSKISSTKAEIEKSEKKEETKDVKVGIEGIISDIIESLRKELKGNKSIDIKEVEKQIESSVTEKNTEALEEAVEKIKTQSNTEIPGDQILKIKCFIKMGKLESQVNSSKSAFNDFFKYFSIVVKNPSFTQSEISKKIEDRISKIKNELDKNKKCSEKGNGFNIFFQNKIGELTEEKDFLKTEYSIVFNNDNDFKMKLNSIEEDIGLIEGVYETFEEATIFLNEESFTVRKVFPTIYGDEFVIEVKIFNKEKNELVEGIGPIRIYMYNGFKIDFSAGFSAAVNGLDKEYILVPSEENDEKQKIVLNSSEGYSLSPYVLLHVYPRWVSRYLKPLEACFGVGLNTRQNIDYYFGLGFAINAKRPVNYDSNFAIVSDRRFKINVGGVLTKIKGLRPRFSEGAEIDKAVKIEELLEEKYRLRFFIGLSYNI